MCSFSLVTGLVNKLISKAMKFITHLFLGMAVLCNLCMRRMWTLISLETMSMLHALGVETYGVKTYVAFASPVM